MYMQDKFIPFLESICHDTVLKNAIMEGYYTLFEERKLPKKYKKGLTKEEQKIMKKEVKTTSKKPTDKADTYKEWESDKKFKERGNKPTESKHTKKYKEMFGESIMESVDKTLKEKSEKSGISKSILKQVFNRGMGAWRTGHRPGVTPHQWAMGRVNSFITGGKTRSTTDKDLWEKHKKNK